MCKTSAWWKAALASPDFLKPAPPCAPSAMSQPCLSTLSGDASDKSRHLKHIVQVQAIIYTYQIQTLSDEKEHVKTDFTKHR